MRRIITAAAVGVAFAAAVAAWAIYPAAGVPILCYHKISDVEEDYSVSPGDFARQMEYLASHGYTAVPLGDLVAHLTAGRPLPPKPIVITFDDGYEDNYLAALPIMEKYGMRATVFVVSDFVGQAPYLNWEQLREMRSRGMGIGSHTLAHRALTELPPDERLRDARASKEGLEWKLDNPVVFLAYPFGKFDASLPGILKEAGYRGAVTTVTGLNKPGDDVYTLKRVNIPRGKFGLWEFKVRLWRANVYSKLGL